MDEEILKRARLWTTSRFDQETIDEVKSLIEREDENELVDRFYKDLEFGTGGMRGIMAAGTNRMNIYTVGRATQGLGNYLLDTYDDAKKRGVCIGYDSRNNSKRFAKECAGVLAANGIRVFLFRELRPTPLLSFAVRHLGCISGIVLTASHNPGEYNGYKVYSPSGSQVVPPEDRKIVDYVNCVEIATDVKRIPYEDGLSKGLISEIDGEVEEAYLRRVVQFAKSIEKGIEETLSKIKRKIRVVYSPLHGTGITLVPRALELIGGADVLTEPEQSIPDGNFPTTVSPNPEEAEALSMAIAFAKKKEADLVFATDPDCDRLGLAVRDPGGEFVPINGNQIGVLFTHMILSSYSRSGLMPPNPVVITTIVSTELAKPIARDFNVDVVEVLTGFKYFGQKMHEYEIDHTRSFVYGFEESYGYLADTFVRDKDGVIASVLALLLIRYATGAYGSVLDYLQSLYEKYGVWVEYQRSFYLKGMEGAEKIKQLMAGLRKKPPLSIAGARVILINDYLNQEKRDLKTGKKEKISGLPESNVLQFYTENNVKVSIRPSGTEPKLKYYFGLNSPLKGSVEETRAMLQKRYEEVSRQLFKRCGLV